MQRLCVLLLLALSVATCWAQKQKDNATNTIASKSRSASSSSSQSGLRGLVREMRQLRRAQEAAETRAANVSLILMSKIMELDARLDAVSNIVEEYYQSLNSIFGHWVTAFVPKTDNRTAVEIPVCPINSCFEKLMLPQNTVDSIEILIKIKGVTSLEGCSLLCGRRPKCAAVYYNQTTSFCKLLTYQHPHLEPKGPLVAIWARSGRRFGRCPSSFNIRWETSRYMFRSMKVSWKYADNWCRRQSGSKLAELTSAEEIASVSRSSYSRRLKYWMVGGIQEKGGKEPSSGWKWYRSNITIPTDGFVWKKGQPDNYKNREHFLNAQYISGSKHAKYTHKLRFNDLDDKFKGHGFLCECIQLAN